MGINKDKKDLWANDIIQSIALYNNWFMEFAPRAFRETRISAARSVEHALVNTDYLQNISVEVLKSHPEVLPILRMSTCPPIARDRLVGLAGVSKSLVENMEDVSHPRVSPHMAVDRLDEELGRIVRTIKTMADPGIFAWLSEGRSPSAAERQCVSIIMTDRLYRSVADTIIRNAQEKRQLAAITQYLIDRGYSVAEAGTKYNEMIAGTFSFHANIPVLVADRTENTINIPVDVIIMPKASQAGDFPVLIEAKSAGDFTNVNKRRKEEAVKVQQLRDTYRREISYNLFLCGYFDIGYLEYEAGEGFDWIWEHRISDLEQLGI